MLIRIEQMPAMANFQLFVFLQTGFRLLPSPIVSPVILWVFSPYECWRVDQDLRSGQPIDHPLALKIGSLTPERRPRQVTSAKSPRCPWFAMRVKSRDSIRCRHSNISTGKTSLRRECTAKLPESTRNFCMPVFQTGFGAQWISNWSLLVLWCMHFGLNFLSRNGSSDAACIQQSNPTEVNYIKTPSKFLRGTNPYIYIH